MSKQEVPFEELDTSDLVVDCVYKGGSVPNMSSELCLWVYEICSMN